MLNQGKLSIEHVPLSSLKLNPQNPRIHSKKQIRALRKSLEEFGWVLPILTDANNVIIGGHALAQAAKELNLDHIPISRIEHLDPLRLKALAIALNRLSELGAWNNAKLNVICQELFVADIDFDIEATGFTLDEIEIRVEDPEEKEDPDDQFTSPVEAQSVSKRGNTWLLGRNKIRCGDATDFDDVKELMNGQSADMCVTDPPYNANYANSPQENDAGTQRPILNDNLGAAFQSFLAAACTNILAVTDGAIYICMSSSELHTLYSAFSASGGHWSTFIIWAKQAFTLGRADYQRKYEPIMYGWKPGAKRYWCGARDQGDVWHFDKPIRNDVHPTMKPVQLVMQAIRNSSERGALVFDPFLGSGTSIIAAERTGRICYGLELDPKYVDVCIRRWQEHTGEKAVRADDGKTFDELSGGK